MHFHRANRIVRLSINTLVTLALMMAIAGSLGASTLPAKALAGSDPAGAGHLLSIDALWERGHIASSVDVDVAPVSGGTLSLSAGLDGFLEGSVPFSSTVRKVAWRQEFELGRHELAIEVGKSARRLGRGRIDTLLMEDDLPGFPQIGYSFEGPRYRYDKVVGDLGNAEQPYKRLIVHRLAYDVTPRLSVGFGEVSVRSEPHPGDLFYDVLPGIPLYFVKYIPGAPSAKDNQMIYLDLELHWNGGTGYGELLVNEFPGGFGISKNPPLYGVLLGIEQGAWQAEYSHLTNYAYSNGDKGSVYSYGGRPLGHWMGGDGDALEVRWHRELTPEWHLTLGGFAWRKGEGKVDDWFGSAKEREENAFLSGVVETTRGIVVGVDGFLGDVSLSGDVRAGVVGNEHHKEGVTGVILTIRAGVAYRF